MFWRVSRGFHYCWVCGFAGELVGMQDIPDASGFLCRTRFGVTFKDSREEGLLF